MTGLSLFSGIGGMDMAFEAAGGHVVAMCEREPFCKAVLNRHWPDIPVYDDVKTLRGDQIEAVDIIYGGFPCQPFSCAGQRNSKDDERYLWPEFSRLVAEIGPRWVLAENVPGILNLAGDDVCEDLERQGYAVGIFCYEAAAVGAPHRRARVFFVAHTESRRPKSWERKLRGNAKETGEKTNHPAPRSSESSDAVPYPGRGMWERGAVEGAFCGKPGETPASDFERSGGAYPPQADSPFSDAESGRQIERTKHKGGRGKRGEPRTWDRSADICSIIPDADGQGKPQQERELHALGGRACDVCETVPDSDMQRLEEQQSAVAEGREWPSFGPAERGCRRQFEPELGGVADGIPLWLDRTWWVREPDIPRVASGKILHRVPRLKALGNAVVPAQIYPLFAAIARIHHSKER